jgi:demethylmenaquinone methyltransferase/2-methoxy-6-polyprenyl-1,4-benzoquinol methylase
MTHLRGEARAAYVQAMFGRIARRYSLMNRLMTGGQDQRWRRFVVRQAALRPGATLLDLATGTGDVAFAALDAVPGLRVVGADFALPMLRVGRMARRGADVRWTAADALCLPFADASFDAVTQGYLIRNVSDISRAFAEQVRVLKPGGRVVVLDTAPPRRGLLWPVIQLHLRVVIPLLGGVVSGDADAYRYLPESTRAFKTPDELAALMCAAGLRDVRYRTFMFGAMAVHWGEKPG